MAFRLSDKAKQWFTHISKKKGFEMEFDSYYFCLITGLKKGKKEQYTNNDTTEIVQYFPGDYKQHRHLIIALFLHTELAALGISLKERNALNKVLATLIDPASATKLSDEGMKLLNRYAYGGFLELVQNFPEPPRTLDSFLVGFYKFINEE